MTDTTSVSGATTLVAEDVASLYATVNGTANGGTLVVDPEVDGLGVEGLERYRVHVPTKYLDLTNQKFELARLPRDFNIEYPEEELSKQKLASLSPTIPKSEWADGTPKRVIEDLLDHWQESFDWRRQEAHLNELPHYRLPVPVDNVHGTLRIHFIWQRSGNPDAIPLLMLHGWPGSFYEFAKVIKPLSELEGGDNGFQFDVIVPSLPGYGFSDGTRKPGFGCEKIAETLDKLMKKLGYTHYVAHGGDWGYPICRFLALNHTPAVRAIHCNNILTKPPSLTRHPRKYLKLKASLASNSRLPGSYKPIEIAGLRAANKLREDGLGYRRMHETKPLTLAYGLTDSPVGLLAWMRDKMEAWTDNYPWTNDEVITWFMLSWTPGPYSGIRLHKEAFLNNEWNEVMTKYSSVPLGHSYFPKEAVNMPGDWGNMIQPLKFFRRHESGGHFAAWER
ncbi:hypothetical protein RUND412_009847 [Rhizina undulata]